MAVTAYQNEQVTLFLQTEGCCLPPSAAYSPLSPNVFLQVTQLKIDNNPFAKGFRDAGNGRREKRQVGGFSAENMR